MTLYYRRSSDPETLSREAACALPRGSLEASGLAFARVLAISSS